MQKRGETFMQSTLGKIVIAIAVLLVCMYIVLVYIAPKLTTEGLFG